jgi:hypothetical protein
VPNFAASQSFDFKYGNRRRGRKIIKKESKQMHLLHDFYIPLVICNARDYFFIKRTRKYTALQNSRMKSHLYYIKVSSPISRYGGAWAERSYSSYSFTTSALDGVSDQRYALTALYPRIKDPPYPLGRRLGGPQSRARHKSLEEKSPCVCQGSNLDRPVFRSVGRLYTD